MDNENFIALDATGDSVCEGENDVQRNSENGPIEIDSQRTSSKDEEDKLNSAEVGNKSDVQYEDGHQLPEASLAQDLNDSDSDMEIEDLNSVPALIDSGRGFSNTGIHSFDHQAQQADNQSSIPPHNDIKITSGNLVHKMDNAQCKDSPCIPEPNLEKDLVDNSSLLQMNVKLTESVLVAKAPNAGGSAEIAFPDKSSIGIKKMGGSCILLS